MIRVCMHNMMLIHYRRDVMITEIRWGKKYIDIGIAYWSNELLHIGTTDIGKKSNIQYCGAINYIIHSLSGAKVC